MSGAPPPGRGRGGRGKGRGRGAGGRKSDAKPKKKGGGRGGNSNSSSNSKPPAPVTAETAQEKAQKAEIARQKQQALEEQRALEQENKATAAARAAQAAELERLHEAVRNAQELVQSTISSTELHQKIHSEMESLAETRKEFEASKKKLKTDLKKCTAFVKKIKSGAVWSMKIVDLEKDIRTLNLSRYIEEVVSGLMECTIKPKLGDVSLLLCLIRSMHVRYSNFLSLLVPQLWSAILLISNNSGGGNNNNKTSSGAGSSSKSSSAKLLTPETIKLRRLYLRVIVRLVLAGMVTDTKPLTKCLGDAAGASDNYNAVHDPMLVVAFAKAAGYEIFRIVPQSVQEACNVIESASSSSLSSATNQSDAADDADSKSTQLVLAKALPLVEQLQGMYKDMPEPEVYAQVCLVHCQGAYEFLQEQLSTTHTKLLKLEQRCDQDRLLSGSLSEAREKGLTDARKLKESLFKSVEALADMLDLQMPTLEDKEQIDDMQQGGLEVWTKTDGSGEDNDLGPFDDEETRAFYCDVPDLLTTIPPALLGLSPEAIEERKAKNQQKYGQEEVASADEEEDAVVAPTDTAEDFMGEEDDEEMGLSEDEGGENEEDAEETDTPHYRLMVLLEQELPECHRREQLDEITDRFCTNHGSTKNSRKRLSKALFLVPRARLDLLPYYSRLAATLDRVWPDIAEPLVTALEQQFHGQSKFKKNQNIEARLKTARYIGELTKFRVAPPMVFLRCLRRCLEDFTGNNVDVACCLLESAGRFLYRMPHTMARLEILLETITRLSKAKNLDERLTALIKAAFHTVKPPPTGPKKRAKQYPPLEAYVRDLLMVQLEDTDASISAAVKQLIRLPWSDPSYDCGSMVCRIMMKACRRGRYRTIHAIAAVADKLRTQRSAAEASVRLLDAVLEELRWALEHPDFRDQQRTITYARLLGELYCLQHVTGQLIIDQLHDFINVGHDIPSALREASKKLAESEAEQIPVLSATHKVSQTIQEDEELEELEENEEDAVEEEAVPQPVAVSEHSKFDPRVPTSADPPRSAYRVKLVCTTLEIAAKNILTRTNLPRVRAFLAAFQRYLFTKIALPADVEFSLLDTFDILDSQWKRFAKRGGGKSDETFERYRSWLEAHNATVAFEESEAKVEISRRSNIENIADESKSVGDLHLDEQISDDGSIVDDDDDDDVSAANSNSDDSIEEEDGDLSSDAETETKDVEEDYEEEFDEEAYMRQLEEEEIEREIRRLTKEAIEKGKSASRKLVHESMIAGSQVVKKKPVDQSKEDGGNPFPAFGMDGKSGVTFQLLKKGNKGKVEAKDIMVPADTNLAKGASKHDGEAAKERDAIKERVLRYEMDSAEAELTGGNVYLEQSKLQANRNKNLSMDTIDKNFGTRGGNLQQPRPQRRVPAISATTGRGVVVRGGPGRGRGRGRSTTGRTLFRG